MSTPRKGSIVKLLRQDTSHLTGKRPVPVGATGEVIAVREGASLVKFAGFGTPRHTDDADLETVLR